MNISKYARAMAAYNRWMNERVYTCAGELSDCQRKRDLGAYFGSIHGTLNHLYVADEAWMQRLRGDEVTMTSAREQRFSDFDQLWAARRTLDAVIIKWAGTIADVDADQPLQFTSKVYKKQIVLPGWAAVLQVFNHQTHHRGQITTLLMQLGKDPGVTDVPLMPDLGSL